MDAYTWAAVGVIGGGIAAYVAYKVWGKWKMLTSIWLKLELVGSETVNALTKFDEMADKYYGEGSIPEHVKDVRGSIENIHRKLTE